MLKGKNAEKYIFKNIIHYPKVCKITRCGELGFLHSKAAADSRHLLPIWPSMDITWDLSRCSYTWAHTDLLAATTSKGALCRWSKESATNRSQGSARHGSLIFRIISFSKKSGQCWKRLSKTSSGHGASKSQLHKVKSKPHPSQLSVPAFLGTIFPACGQQNWRQRAQPKVQALLE